MGLYDSNRIFKRPVINEPASCFQSVSHFQVLLVIMRDQSLEEVPYLAA